MKIERINPELIDHVWESIEPWVKNALGIDKSYESQDIKEICRGGKLGLWLITTDKLKGFFTCTINDAPHGKTAYAPWLGGEDLGEWVEPAFGLFKEWLKDQGCISFSWIGRRAWKRFLGADYEGCFYLMNL